jgi:C1A family cysteine protease
MKAYLIGKLGWHRDLPDFRDYSPQTKDVKSILIKSKQLTKSVKSIKKSVDLRVWCSPIEDQKDLGSCTANAGVGLLEYFQKRAHGKYLDASRLFLYKTTRNLLGWTGDTGAYLRTTMKSMVLFGVPPEQYWPYYTKDFDNEPPAFCYSFAENYKTIKYFRLDCENYSPKKVLDEVKKYLAAKLPSMFGFSVYSSIPGLNEGTGDIPFPSSGDSLLGGHAIVAVGYDDNKKIGECKGALLIRNSWGTAWGENGYGWLPYDYILKGLAVDFWSLVYADFVNTEIFE